jgi:transposase-like protein
MARRKSYSREFKLEVVRFYHNSNLSNTTKQFELNSKTVLRWVKQEKTLILSRYKSKRVKGSKRVMWQKLEDRLVKEIEVQRQKGLRVKKWWVIGRAKKLKQEIDPSHPLTFSRGWFDKFVKRNGLSYRETTSIAQTPPENKTEKLREFHTFIRRNAVRGAGKKQRGRPLGKWTKKTIANMDQTPMPFVFGGGKTYEKKGAKTVWVRAGQSGQEKRQCTVQLTVFADGEPRVKPMVIFKGKGKALKEDERKRWDDRVEVVFQENAWCDEAMMLHWVEKLWRPAIAGQSKSLLVADVHAAQKTEQVLQDLKDLGTTPALIPPGCTSLVQPLDVVFNRTFKQKCGDLSTKHMDVSKILFFDYFVLIVSLLTNVCLK